MTSAVIGLDIKNHFEKNHFTNQFLETIGEQLDRIEDYVQKTPISKPKIDTKPIFKPYQPSAKALKDVSGSFTNFIQEIDKRIEQLKQCGITLDSQNIVLDTPDKGKEEGNSSIVILSEINSEITCTQTNLEINKIT